MRFGFRFFRLLPRFRPSATPALLARRPTRPILSTTHLQPLLTRFCSNTAFSQLEIDQDYYSTMSIEDLHNISGIKPLLVLQAGETHEVQGSGSSVYQLKAHDECAAVTSFALTVSYYAPLAVTMFGEFFEYAAIRI